MYFCKCSLLFFCLCAVSALVWFVGFGMSAPMSLFEFLINQIYFQDKFHIFRFGIWCCVCALAMALIYQQCFRCQRAEVYLKRARRQMLFGRSILIDKLNTIAGNSLLPKSKKRRNSGGKSGNKIKLSYFDGKQ